MSMRPDQSESRESVSDNKGLDKIAQGIIAATENTKGTTKQSAALGAVKRMLSGGLESVDPKLLSFVNFLEENKRGHFRAQGQQADWNLQALEACILAASQNLDTFGGVPGVIDGVLDITRSIWEQSGQRGTGVVEYLFALYDATLADDPIRYDAKNGSIKQRFKSTPLEELYKALPKDKYQGVHLSSSGVKFRR